MTGVAVAIAVAAAAFVAGALVGYALGRPPRRSRRDWVELRGVHGAVRQRRRGRHRG